MNQFTRRVGALSTITLLSLAGCSSGGSSNSGSGPATHSPMSSHSTMSKHQNARGGSPSSSTAANTAMISIKNFAFPKTISVKAGSTVKVSNADTTAHTVTSDQAGLFDITVDPSGTASFKAPSKPGSYPYHCTFHANMHGTLVVK